MKHSNGAIRAGRLVTHAGTLTWPRTKLHVHAVNAVRKRKNIRKHELTGIPKKVLTFREHYLCMACPGMAYISTVKMET